jgi:hypothetical protein
MFNGYTRDSVGYIGMAMRFRLRGQAEASRGLGGCETRCSERGARLAVTVSRETKMSECAIQRNKTAG